MSPKRIAQLLMAMMLCMVWPAQAMSPGADKLTWDPAKIPQLTPHQVAAFKAAHCDVVSYRDEEYSGENPPNDDENDSDKPDGRDHLMLVHGELAKPGQKDVLALCEHETTGEEFFFAVWGGPAHCASALMMSTVSRYWKIRASNLDHYGSGLDAVLPADLREQLTSAAKTPTHDSSDMGDSVTWVLKSAKWPAFDHAAIALGGNYSVTYYCDGKNWIPLYDSYSTEMD